LAQLQPRENTRKGFFFGGGGGGGGDDDGDGFT
jgi:hypothetical protein